MPSSPPNHSSTSHLSGAGPTLPSLAPSNGAEPPLDGVLPNGLSLAVAGRGGNNEGGAAAQELDWDELLAAFPMVAQSPRSTPIPRPRSATVSADIMVRPVARVRSWL